MQTVYHFSETCSPKDLLSSVMTGIFLIIVREVLWMISSVRVSKEGESADMVEEKGKKSCKKTKIKDRKQMVEVLKMVEWLWNGRSITCI